MAWYVVITKDHGVQQLGPLPAHMGDRPTETVLTDQVHRLTDKPVLVLTFPVPFGWGVA